MGSGTGMGKLRWRIVRERMQEVWDLLEDAPDKRIPVLERRGHIACGDEVVRLRVEPFLLDVVDDEADIGQHTNSTVRLPSRT